MLDSERPRWGNLGRRLSAMRTWCDEVRLQLHLAGMEERTQRHALEKRLARAFSQNVARGRVVAARADSVLEDVELALQDLRDRLLVR